MSYKARYSFGGPSFPDEWLAYLCETGYIQLREIKVINAKERKSPGRCSERTPAIPKDLVIDIIVPVDYCKNT